MMAAQTGNPWMWDFKAQIYGFAVAMAMELSRPEPRSRHQPSCSPVICKATEGGTTTMD